MTKKLSSQEKEANRKDRMALKKFKLQQLLEIKKQQLAQKQAMQQSQAHQIETSNTEQQMEQLTAAASGGGQVDPYLKYLRLRKAKILEKEVTRNAKEELKQYYNQKLRESWADREHAILSTKNVVMPDPNDSYNILHQENLVMPPNQINMFAPEQQPNQKKKDWKIKFI